MTIDPEHRHIVCSLVAHIEELARRIEIKTPRIIPTSPFLAHELQFAVLPNRKNSNAVMQPIPGINESAIGGNQYLRAEVTPGKSRRQAGNGLSRCQLPVRDIVVEQDDVRAFLLERVTPAGVRMKCEMPRPIARRQRNRSRI